MTDEPTTTEANMADVLGADNSLHFATIFEAIADQIGSATAIVQGTTERTWADFDDRAARIASALTGAGVSTGARFGMYLYNTPEYLEAQYAGFKQRMVPVNVNYRYLDDELHYLLDNSDAEAVFFHTSLGDRIARVADRLPNLKLLVQVDDGPAPDGSHGVDGAVWFEDLVAANEPAERIERQADDLYMLYTGGTTGMPKGVMYEIGPTTIRFLTSTGNFLGLEGLTSREKILAAVAGMHSQGMQYTAMPCCPLMHGTGMWVGGIPPHLLGGKVVLLETRGLDPAEVWSTAERTGTNNVVIVGDAFARPLLRALEDRASSGAAPWDLTSVQLMVSSGAMWSTEVKQGLFEHVEHLTIVDALGSTEAGTMAMAVSTKDSITETAKFTMAPTTKVFREDDTEVTPGTGEVGMVAVNEGVPLAYFKDEAKSDKTFRVIDGVRYSFPGDMAFVEADGTVTLLGRGSNCINSGGEKIYPEEVEEAVKTHAAVADCLVFGVPDERFGQRIEGVFSLGPDEVAVSAEDLIIHVKTQLSSYKAPKVLHIVDTVPRAPNGKADYKTAQKLAGHPD